jgi:hypothetical protein
MWKEGSRDTVLMLPGWKTIVNLRMILAEILTGRLWKISKTLYHLCLLAADTYIVCNIKGFIFYINQYKHCNVFSCEEMAPLFIIVDP